LPQPAAARSDDRDPPEPNLSEPDPPEPNLAEPEPAADQHDPARLPGDEPAPITPDGPRSSPWLADAHRRAAPASADWLVRRQQPAPHARESQWLIGSPQPHTPPRQTPTAVLASRRKRAVEAYCAEFCPPGLVARTAADVLEQARARAGGPPTDRGLLEAAREVTATHGEPPAAECAPTASLLAARASGRLANGELSALERHLAVCMCCQATELKSARAERVFATAISDADPAEVLPEPPPLTSDREPVPSSPPQHRRWRGALVLGALAALAAAAVGAVALTGTHHSGGAPAPAAGTTTRATQVRSGAHHRARRHRHHAAVRHRDVHRAAAGAAPAASAPASTASAPSTGSAPASSGASAPASSSSSAVQSSPPPSSGGGGSSGNGGTGGGSVAAVQQGGLPAQSAPTQGIGSGGSGH
jgi:uncharacterized membrane protein YgcG